MNVIPKLIFHFYVIQPTKRLTTNLHRTKEIYYSQVKMLNLNPIIDKQDLINEMKKLMALGFVDKFENQTNEQRSIINSSSVKYYISWLENLTNEQRPIINSSSVKYYISRLENLTNEQRPIINSSSVKYYISWLENLTNEQRSYYQL